MIDKKTLFTIIFVASLLLLAAQVFAACGLGTCVECLDEPTCTGAGCVWNGLTCDEPTPTPTPTPTATPTFAPAAPVFEYYQAQFGTSTADFWFVNVWTAPEIVIVVLLGFLATCEIIRAIFYAFSRIKVAIYRKYGK